MRHKKFMPDECKFCCKAWEKGCNGIWNYTNCDVYQDEKERVRKKKVRNEQMIERTRKRLCG